MDENEPQSWNNRLSKSWLLLGLVPLLVYGGYYTVLDAVRTSEIEFAIVPLDQFSKIAASEAQLRYFWVSAFALSAAISIAVACAACLALHRMVNPRDRLWVFGLLAVIVLLVVLSETGILGSSNRWYQYLGNVGEYTPPPIKPQLCEPGGLYCVLFHERPAELGSINLISLLHSGLNIVIGGGALALGAVTLVMIYTLSSPPKGAPLNVRAAASAKALRQQHTFLQLAAGVFIFALIAMVSWMYWPTPYLLGDAARTDYQNLLVGSAILQGVGYSLGIAATYLPAAFILRQRIESLEEEAATKGEDLENWLSERGLAIAPLNQLRDIATLLLPAILSAVPALEKLWGG